MKPHPPFLVRLYPAIVDTLRRHGGFPLAVFLIHEICAHVVDGYRLWPPVDVPLHFFGGLAMACFFAGAVRVFAEHRLLRRPEWPVQMALVFGLTCAIAVGWEFAEWTADHTLGTHCQLSLDDTLGDLLMGLLGGLAGLLPLIWRGVHSWNTIRTKSTK